MSDATIEDYVKMVFTDAVIGITKDSNSDWFKAKVSIDIGNKEMHLTHRFPEFELVSYIGDFNRDTAGIIVSKLCNAIMDQKGQE